MQTSKLTSLYIFLGMLIIMGILSVPAQAKTVHSGNEQVSGIGEFVGKPPTKTKNAKSTSVPKKTATPKPANTATKVPTRQNTSIPPTSSTSISLPTQIGTAGTPVSTLNVPATLSTSVTSAYSPTPTALGMSTVAAHQTETAGASFLTSTALAHAYSPTPTNFGASTPTATFTPNATEHAATFVALTTTPLREGSQSAATSSPTLSPTAVQAPVNFNSTPAIPAGQKMYWIIGVSAVILLSLFYLAYKEWKKYSMKSG